MSDVALVVSDVDGTLVRTDKSLSPRVVEAVKRVEAAGVPFTLISARPPSGMLWIAAELGLTRPIAAFNGGTVVRPDGTVVSAERLRPDEAYRALGLLDRPGITPWLFADGHWYAQTPDNGHVPHEIRSAGVQPTIRRDFAALTARVDKIVGVCDDHALLAALEPEVAHALGDQATVARSQLYYLDVTAPRANKGDGLAILAETFGVPLARIAVFGDQRNDLPMFARAGLSVAMGQGPAEVRGAATHVVGANDDDGVAQAIARYVLPDAAA